MQQINLNKNSEIINFMFMNSSDKVACFLAISFIHNLRARKSYLHEFPYKCYTPSWRYNQQEIVKQRDTCNNICKCSIVKWRYAKKVSRNQLLPVSYFIFNSQTFAQYSVDDTDLWTTCGQRASRWRQN